MHKAMQKVQEKDLNEKKAMEYIELIHTSDSYSSNF